MQGIILLHLFAFALGFHMSHVIRSAIIIHHRSNNSKPKSTTYMDKLKKCVYIDSQFSNTCPRQAFDGYKNLYEKSPYIELLEFQKKECFRKPSLFGVLALLFIIVICFINCLC